MTAPRPFSFQTGAGLRNSNRRLIADPDFDPPVPRTATGIIVAIGEGIAAYRCILTDGEDLAVGNLEPERSELVRHGRDTTACQLGVIALRPQRIGEAEQKDPVFRHVGVPYGLNELLQVAFTAAVQFQCGAVKPEAEGSRQPVRHP